MKISLLLVGKTVNKDLNALIADYVGRLGHYVPFEMVVIPDLKNTKSLPVEQQRKKEGELISKYLKAGDFIVLLDEKGAERRSVEFADYIRKKQNQAFRRLVFIIGGAYGFSDDIYNMCNDKVSLSKMTFSHQMVRLIFVEQLYRAFAIINGEPYHHE